MQLYFVTGNKGKFEEVKNLIESGTNGKIKLIQVSLDIPEFDSQDLITISQDKARKAFKKLKKTLIVDDSGVYFDEYTGFPGPLAKRVFKGLGFKGLERLLKDAENKSGRFVTVISYISKKLKEPISFVGELKGIYDFSLVSEEERGQKRLEEDCRDLSEVLSRRLSEEEKEKMKFLPYKYIFKPEGFSKFYFELTQNENQQVSQRAKAVKKFVEWFKRRFKF